MVSPWTTSLMKEEVSAMSYHHGRSSPIRNGKCQTNIFFCFSFAMLLMSFLFLVSVVTVNVVEVVLSLLLSTEEGKSSCGDGAASKGDNSCKLVEWAVCRTVVINNYYVSPSKKEE
eukprot:9870858-Ditylum_brightwellii.AAC.1